VRFGEVEILASNDAGLFPEVLSALIFAAIMLLESRCDVIGSPT